MPRHRADLRCYLEALYAGAPDSSFIEVRFRVADGMGQAFHSVHDQSGVAETIVELARSTDVYLGVLPRRRRGGTRDDLVNHAEVLWADCDTEASIATLRSFVPPPSMVVMSGTASNCHAYWLLSERIDLDVVERANRRLAHALGADAACAGPGRILRPCETFNFKHEPPTPVRLERGVTPTGYALGDIIGEGDDPADPLPPRIAHGERVDTDQLLAISPIVYVERLLGVRVPRNCKVECPLHDDRTPSMHVYAEPHHGWYCYGCCRGGSIYDFAALLWLTGQSSDGRTGWKLRGREFLWVRQRLVEIFLGERRPKQPSGGRRTCQVPEQATALAADGLACIPPTRDRAHRGWVTQRAERTSSSGGRGADG